MIFVIDLYNIHFRESAFHYCSVHILELILTLTKEDNIKLRRTDNLKLDETFSESFKLQKRSLPCLVSPTTRSLKG